MGPLDKDVIRDDALHAVGDGFTLDIRSHWYRSLPLTSLAVLGLAVDGEKVPEEDMTGFTTTGKPIAREASSSSSSLSA